MICLPLCTPGRHAPTCPNSRSGIASRSGPSGRGKQQRSNVDSAKLQRLRELLRLPAELTPNAILDAAIEIISKGYKVTQ